MGLHDDSTHPRQIRGPCSQALTTVMATQKDIPSTLGGGTWCTKWSGGWRAVGAHMNERGLGFLPLIFEDDCKICGGGTQRDTEADREKGEIETWDRKG